MKQKLKKAWKVTQVLTLTGLVISGAYVANEIAGTTDYYKNLFGEEVKANQEIKKVLDNYTEDEILRYLAEEAKSSSYVTERMELAEEKLITDKVTRDLDRMKLKVTSGQLHEEEYLGEYADRNERIRQENLENE